MVVVGPAGRIIGVLPEGVRVEDLDVAALRRGEVVGGSRAGRLYAAAPRAVERTGARQPGLGVVVLTRSVESGVGRSVG